MSRKRYHKGPQGHIAPKGPQGKASSQNQSLIANIAERSMIANRMMLALGTTHQGKRDLYEVFGYNLCPTPADYRFKYQRQDIAGRVVTAYPNAIWSNPPEIIDDDENQEETEFEKAVEELAKKLKLWHYLQRVDTLSQMFRYSVLIIGSTGGGDLKTPRQPKSKVVYLMPYGEDSVKIQEYETDTSSERFGKPTLYQVNLFDTSQGQKQDKPGKPQAGGTQYDVHWSRVIHIADNLLDNDVFGKPILEGIMNRLDDLEKLAGGGSEMYWLNARGGINLNVAGDANIADPEALSQAADDYVNQLTRVLKTKGMEVKMLQATIQSPEHQAALLLQLISGATGIPVRILTGVEAASTGAVQDDDNWLARVDERRVRHCEPTLIYPIIDLMIASGDLPQPKDGKYTVKWPALVNLSDDKVADIAVKKSQALATYANSPGSELLVTPQQFVEEVLQLEYRENEIAIIEKEQADQEEADMKMMQDLAAGNPSPSPAKLDKATGKPILTGPPVRSKFPSTKPVKTIANSWHSIK